MADPVVHGLEVVDVEYDEGELPIVALCPGDFPCQRLVEEPVVVEPGESVQVGELAGLLESGARSRSQGPPGLLAPREG